MVRDKCHAWLERPQWVTGLEHPQWVTGEWTSQCEHWIQQVQLGRGKQLATVHLLGRHHRMIDTWSTHARVSMVVLAAMRDDNVESWLN